MEVEDGELQSLEGETNASGLKFRKQDTLSPEILEEIRNSLFDADLVLELNNKTKRYNLMDYQEN